MSRMSARVLARESSRAKPSDSRVREVTESANLELRVLNLIRSLLAELGSQRVLRRAFLEASLWTRRLGTPRTVASSSERVSVRLSYTVMTEAERDAGGSSEGHRFRNRNATPAARFCC